MPKAQLAIQSASTGHSAFPRVHVPSIGKPRSLREPWRSRTAIVYCEGNFGCIDGKTANGLVRHSERYTILAVIDSHKAGLDAGTALGEQPNSIPVCEDLGDALAHLADVPDCYILGMAPASGMLSIHERTLVLQAMDHGMDIVSGLHEFLTDDAEFVAASARTNVTILDVRKPRAKRDLRTFTGRISEVSCAVVAVMGTDCAIGKRTTATILTHALNQAGLKTVLVGTGQTGLIQGARYGVALDAIPAQFGPGEMEGTIVDAFEEEQPDVIVVEGQGSLSHPAYATSAFILRGSCPDAVLLQHAPGRPHRCDFPEMAMPTPASEINLIETFSGTKVIGLCLNHENMTPPEVEAAMAACEVELGVPVTDPLSGASAALVDMVVAAFPELRYQSAHAE